MLSAIPYSLVHRDDIFTQIPTENNTLYYVLV